MCTFANNSDKHLPSKQEAINPNLNQTSPQHSASSPLLVMIKGAVPALESNCSRLFTGYLSIG